MGDHGHKPDGQSAGYETRDVNIKMILVWGAILAVIVIFSFFYMTYLFRRYAAQIARERPVASVLAEPDPMPPSPRLRVNALLDVAELRAYEGSLLTNYAWMSEAEGIARVPVARAMELVLEHGVPSPPPISAMDTNAPAAAPAPAAEPEHTAPPAAEPEPAAEAPAPEAPAVDSAAKEAQ